MTEWDDPEQRVSAYRIQMATNWQFHPRAVDELTIGEFEHFAAQSDAIRADQEEQERDMERQRAR